MSGTINLKTITQYYRILGLPIEATLDDCRQSRNRLLQKFHPDKQVSQWLAGGAPEERVHLIQEAYTYIREHYQEIQVYLKPIQKNQFTNQMPKQSKSHWVYSQIQNDTN